MVVLQMCDDSEMDEPLEGYQPVSVEPTILRMFMERKGIGSVSQLARLTGVSAPTLFSILSDEEDRRWNSQALNRLAKVFGVHPVLLLRGPVKRPEWMEKAVEFLSEERTPFQDERMMEEGEEVDE